MLKSPSLDGSRTVILRPSLIVLTRRFAFNKSRAERDWGEPGEPAGGGVVRARP
jgi:hypothetical protein